MTQRLRLFLTSTILFYSISSFAGLQVFPTRVVLNDKKRSGQISLKHEGAAPMKYTITPKFYIMSENGDMNPIKNLKDVPDSAISYIKFSPQAVTLMPRIEQIVRILTTVPKDLAEGEYRMHLYFEEADEPTAPEPSSPEGNEAKMTLKARMAIAVPVILRHGNPEGTVSLSNLKVVTLPNKKSAFSVEVERTGRKYAFGDFRVYFKGHKNQDEVLVGTVNGFSSYIDKRKAVFPFQDPLPTELKEGTLRIELLESATAEGEKVALASTQVDI